MARPASGTVIREPTARGTFYSLKVRYKGERLTVRLGGEWEGWDEDRVQDERELIAKLVARGEWVAPKPAAPKAATAPTPDSMTLQVWASLVLAKKRARLSDNGYADLEWKLTVAVAFLGDWQVTELTSTVIDNEFVTKALKERAEIEDAAAKGAPLMESVTDKRKRTYRRARRGLSRGSINKVLAGLSLALKDAKREGLIESNPVDDELRVRAQAPQRSFLHPRQMDALLTASQEIEVAQRGLTWEKVRLIRSSEKSAVALARELHISDSTIGKVRRGVIWADEAGPRRRNDITRHALIATLLMAGLRVSECCALRGADVDLASGVIRVRRDSTKSDAGERVIAVVPALREILVVHRSERHYGPGDLVFPTRDGTVNTANNVRSRVIAIAHERANELLGAAGDAQLIAHLTPHSLRRTFASILAELGVAPRRAMYLLGHTNPKMTMGVYQQVLDMSDNGIALIEKLLGGNATELFVTLSGRRAAGSFGPVMVREAEIMPSWPGDDGGQEG